MKQNLKRILFIAPILVAGMLTASGCSQLSPEFQQMGSQVLGQVGLSSSQANRAMSFGESLGSVRTSLTDEEEYYLGRGVSAMVFSRYKALNNREVNNYVSRVGLVVSGHSERPETFNGYRFIVLDSEEVNAFAAPGGFIFITKGLLKLIPDEDALAAVLAHEVAHVVHEHGVRAIARANLTDAFITLGRDAASSYTPADLQVLTRAFEDSISDVFETMLTKGYSRSQEYDADTYAVNLAKKAGYNPDGLAQVLHQIDQIDGSGGWYSTHPRSSDRLRNVRRISKLEETLAPGQEVRRVRFARAMRSIQ